MGALTGIFSFIIFLPCLFKENHFDRQTNLNIEETNNENTRRVSLVEYLAESNNLDLKLGDSNADTTDNKKDSVASRDTTSSGFVSVDTNSTPRTFWGRLNPTLPFLW